MRLLVTGGSGFIGTNLVDYFAQREINIVNVDIREPKKDSHRKYWIRCSILDLNSLIGVFKNFKPTHVIHLAARTDTYGKTLSDYIENTEGTKNVLTAIKSCDSVERVLVTSTQFVCRPGKVPLSDEDYDPYTVYGYSKVITEKLTRYANLDCIWTIVRPTNIWGPWHPRYPYEFWRVLSKGLYFHPNGKQPLRSYGYVGNVVWQIDQIFKAPSEIVHKRTYYLGDRPMPIIDWVNAFAKVLTGRGVRIAPRWSLRILGYVGDVASLFNFRFPLTSSRFRSMTEDYIVPIEPTFKAFGEPPIPLEEGVKQTAIWLKQEGFVERIYLNKIN